MNIVYSPPSLLLLLQVCQVQKKGRKRGEGRRRKSLHSPPMWIGRETHTQDALHNNNLTTRWWGSFVLIRVINSDCIGARRRESHLVGSRWILGLRLGMRNGCAEAAECGRWTVKKTSVKGATNPLLHYTRPLCVCVRWICRWLLVIIFTPVCTLSSINIGFDSSYMEGNRRLEMAQTHLTRLRIG